MSLLLDSHTFLWWLLDDRRLGEGARERIADSGTRVRVSAATIWELSIKAALGRLELGDVDLVSEIATNRFEPLPILPVHAQLAGALPRHHDDPFDRMLIAQARLEGLVCATRDKIFASYGVAIVW